jgi:hypothetical protein
MIAGQIRQLKNFSEPVGIGFTLSSRVATEKGLAETRGGV